MKKILLSILLSIALLATSVASAMDETIDCQNDGSGKTVITGTAEPGELVTIRIFKKKKHLGENGDFSYAKAKTDLLAAAYNDNIQSVLCFADQILADEDGVFTLDTVISNMLDSTGAVSTEAVSDIYVVVAVSESGKAETEFLFVDPTERTTGYETLSGMKESTEDDVVKFLDDYKYALNIYDPILDEISSDKAYALMYDYLMSVGFDVEDKSDDESIATPDDIMKKLVIIEALNQSKIGTIKNYESQLLLADSEIHNWYTKKLVDDKFKSALTSRLSAKSFGDIAEFDDGFAEAVVLQWIASSDGIDDCMSIIGDYKEDIGYSKDAVILEEAVREVMGTSFQNYAALKSAIDGYEGEDDDSSSSGSGSSNRGGGGGFGGATVSGPVETPPQAINMYFSDLGSTPWAIEAINYLSEKKVLAGKGNGIFAPGDNVTRAEFAKILVTAFGFTQKSDIVFVDVSEDSWYSEFVKIAVGSGIANGKGDGLFGPEENITRQDMAVMLMNAAKLAKAMKVNDAAIGFADEAEISHYAKGAVNTLAKAGIINGTGDGKFAPKSYATRAQAAKLVHGLLTY